MTKQRKKRISYIMGFCILIITLSSCGKAPVGSAAVPGSASVPVSTAASENFAPPMTADTREYAPTEIKGRRFAYELLDDDWVAIFRYDYVEDNTIPYVFSFVINNMRCRYNEEWSETLTENTDEKGDPVYFISYTKNPVKSWFSVNDARRKDREKIKVLFEQGLSPEQMLAISEDSLQFEELDKDLFLRLIRKALTEEQAPERDVPKRRLDYFYSMEYESSFRDDYKFQICYLMSLPGYLEKIVIDVLYKTGEAYNDYDQLSDLVRDGKASTEQQEAYALIRKIEDAVVAQNRFDALCDEYEELELGGIDFGRLWQFMQDLESGAILFDDGAKYNWEKNRPNIRKEMTAEEFATREVPTGIEETP